MHGAIMAALLQRHNSGRGQYIDANLFNTQLATLANIGSNWLNAGQEVICSRYTIPKPLTQGRRWGTAHPSIVPYQACSSTRCSLTSQNIGICYKRQATLFDRRWQRWPIQGVVPSAEAPGSRR